MKKEMRIQIAQDTLAIIEKGFYTNSVGDRVDVQSLLEEAKLQTKLFMPEALQDILADFVTANKYVTAFEVTNETTLDAMRRMDGAGVMHIAILNFASAKNPGGGFLGGALAQEECIARASGLYPCLLQAVDYYTSHRNLATCLYSDRMIYSPDVPVLKDEDGALLDKPVTTAIITSPAVNAGAVMKNEPGNVDKIIPVMRDRIEKLLALCVHYGHEELVLGAWGCGVFRNNPADIAGLFKEALEGRFKGQFRRVVFAVKTDKEEIIGPFREQFS